MRAASEKLDRERKDVSKAVDICPSRWVSTVVSSDDGVFGDERLAPAETVDGTVVEISVCTRTRVNRVL
jgi:hypothetical protein